MAKILVVDDESEIRGTISDILEDENYTIVIAEDGEVAQKKVMIEDLDAVVLDVLMPNVGGLEVLGYIHDNFPVLPVIIMSGHGNIRMAVEAMKKGAFDFIEKPLSMERLIAAVRNAVKFKDLQTENRNLRMELNRHHQSPKAVAESSVMKRIVESLEQIAESGASVMITGENGTGKEVIAKMIHYRSLRKNKPFIGVNCAAIQDTLIESELFGYEKGAFTGANKLKKGQFEEAHQGTLFLDEVADLSLSAQAKVLRVIQENELRRVGGNKSVKVDVRLIAATNKDLAKEIQEGNFRQDLFFRLNVIPLYLPALRERTEDIRPLMNFFLDEYQKNRKKKVKISPDVYKIFENRKWPGNVRELKNFVERMVIMCQKEVIEKEDVLSLSFPDIVETGSKYDNLTLKDAKRDFEKQLIMSRLMTNQMSVTKTASTLGIERTYLHRKIKELKIDEEISFITEKND